MTDAPDPVAAGERGEEGAEAVQAACVAFGGAGLLILGAPGSGKSRLALDLIARGGVLVADDLVRLSHDGQELIGAPDPTTAGLIEARGLGLLDLAALDPAVGAAVPIRLAIRLSTPGDAPAERLPERRFVCLCGRRIPLVCIQDGGGLDAALMAVARGAALLDPDAPLPTAGGRPTGRLDDERQDERHGGTGERSGDMSGEDPRDPSVAAHPQPGDPTEPRSEIDGGGVDGREIDGRSARIVVVTGRSGAGRSTAINALEDLGFEKVDTPPLPFVAAIASRALSMGKRLAIGLDAKTDGFSPDAFAALLKRLRAEEPSADAALLVSVFLDCEDEALLRRYVETRRRHPLAPRGAVEDGLIADRRATDALRALTDMIIDTSRLTPADLKRTMRARFADDDAPGLALTVMSFSYKTGLPPDADLVVDCRFLRNPHYDEILRPLDGRDPNVAAFVAADPLYRPFLDQQIAQAELLLPAFRGEGKSYLTVAFGCTGGKHRSVAVAEAYAAALASRGWTATVRHRERDPMSEGTGPSRPAPHQPSAA